MCRLRECFVFYPEARLVLQKEERNTHCQMHEEIVIEILISVQTAKVTCPLQDGCLDGLNSSHSQSLLLFWTVILP